LYKTIIQKHQTLFLKKASYSPNPLSKKNPTTQTPFHKTNLLNPKRPFTKQTSYNPNPLSKTNILQPKPTFQNKYPTNQTPLFTKPLPQIAPHNLLQSADV
jgi:hypothetical protein